MADRMELMEMLHTELHQFTRDHPKAVSDPYSESAYQYTAMRRSCVLLSLLPMGVEKINVLMDMDNHDTLQSILYFQKKNASILSRHKSRSFCVELYVDEIYKEYRRAALVERLGKNYGAYEAESEKLSQRQIIEHARELGAKDSIVRFSGKMANRLDLADMEALLTLENPLEAIYRVWRKQRCRDTENLAGIASEVAKSRRVYLDSQTGAPESDDEQLYRENHMNVPDPLPVLHYMERLDDFWSVADDEFNDLDLDVVDLKQYRKVYDYMNSPHIAGLGLINLEALLTFSKPMGEIIRQMDRYQYEAAVSTEMIAAQRLTELSTYMSRIDNLPTFLQEPVRAFKKQFEQAMAYQIAAPAQEALEPEDEEYGEGR